MTLLDVLRVAVTGIVVLGAIQAVTIGAVITSEMVEKRRAMPGEGLAGVDDAAA